MRSVNQWGKIARKRGSTIEVSSGVRKWLHRPGGLLRMIIFVRRVRRLAIVLQVRVISVLGNWRKGWRSNLIW